VTGPVLSQRQRRGVVWDGARMGYTARQLAQYIGVSETTIRRDMRVLAAGRDPARTGPDSFRSRPGDTGIRL
jgi:predicted DNA-binding transcriptional regulator YafY